MNIVHILICRPSKNNKAIERTILIFRNTVYSGYIKRWTTSAIFRLRPDKDKRTESGNRHGTALRCVKDGQLIDGNRQKVLFIIPAPIFLPYSPQKHLPICDRPYIMSVCDKCRTQGAGYGLYNCQAGCG